MAKKLPFDPAAIIQELTETQNRAAVLVALLRSYGIEVPAIEAVPETTAQEPRRRMRARVVRRPTLKARVARGHEGRQPKLADLAVQVIQGRNGRAHGKDIVAALLAAGYMKNVAHPDSNISTALSRDPRVEREPNARNMWRLVA